MRQLLITLSLVATVLIPAVALSGQAAAVNPFSNTCNSGGAGSGSTVCRSVRDQQNNNNENPIIKIIRGAINVISFIVGIAAIIGLVVSGIRFMTAGGDSNAVASARSGLIYSLVGIAVVALSQAIVLFALGR